jgi:hypothetical protein
MSRARPPQPARNRINATRMLLLGRDPSPAGHLMPVVRPPSPALPRAGTASSIDGASMLLERHRWGIDVVTGRRMRPGRATGGVCGADAHAEARDPALRHRAAARHDDQYPPAPVQPSLQPRSNRHSSPGPTVTPAPVQPSLQPPVRHVSRPAATRHACHLPGPRSRRPNPAKGPTAPPAEGPTR